MIELDPAIKVLNRPTGMIFSPDKRSEITHLAKLVQNHLHTLPETIHTNEPLHGDEVVHRDPRTVGFTILNALNGQGAQDLLNGTQLPCIKFTADEAVLLQDAAATINRGEVTFLQQDTTNVVDLDKYGQLASQILAVNLQRAA